MTSLVKFTIKHKFLTSIFLYNKIEKKNVKVKQVAFHIWQHDDEFGNIKGSFWQYAKSQEKYHLHCHLYKLLNVPLSL